MVRIGCRTTWEPQREATHFLQQAQRLNITKITIPGGGIDAEPTCIHRPIALCDVYAQMHWNRRDFGGQLHIIQIKRAGCSADPLNGQLRDIRFVCYTQSGKRNDVLLPCVCEQSCWKM